MGRKFLNKVDPVSGVVLTVGGAPPDANGNVAAPTGGYDGTTVLAADLTSSTVSGATSTLTIPAGRTTGTYEVRGVLLCTSAATTTGVQVAVTAPTGGKLALRWSNPTTATAVGFGHDRTGGTWQASLSAPYAGGTPWPVFLDGALIVTATTTTAMTVLIRTEIAASAVTLKAGSFLSWRKITPAASPIEGAWSVDALPAGTVVSTATTTRPTARTDLVVLFTGADPTTAAFDGDVWLGP